MRNQKDKNLENSPTKLENILFSAQQHVQQHIQMQDSSPIVCIIPANEKDVKEATKTHKTNQTRSEAVPRSLLLLVLGLFMLSCLHFVLQGEQSVM